MTIDQRYNDEDYPEICLSCNKRDDEVTSCAIDGCGSYIHPECGVKCSLCRATVCLIHYKRFDDDVCCSACYPGVLKEFLEQFAAEGMDVQ